MPYKYGGRRSKGCNLCRKRKVRCGEERPACIRCVRTGKECVYRTEVDLLFHDETAHASARAERMWLARANQDSSDDHTVSSLERASRNSGSLSRMPMPLKELTLLLEDVALSRFMHDFVIEPDDKTLAFGHFDFIPRIYCANKSGSSVGTAIEAVALANLAKRCRVPSHVAAAASARYGKALALTQEALQDPTNMLTDETVLSCHLLGLYELIHPSATSYTDWNNHRQGAMALLKLRGFGQVKDNVGLSIFKQMYATEVISTLRYCKAPAILPELCKKASQPEQYKIFAIVSDTSRIVATFLGNMNAGGLSGLDDEIQVLHDLFIRSEELQGRIKKVQASLPPAFTFQRASRDETVVSSPRWLQRALRDRRAPKISHKKYSNLNYANCRNWLRYGRVRLLQLEILISMQLGMDKGLIEMKMGEIECLVDELTSTIVFFLISDASGEFNPSVAIDEVRGFRFLFLLRSMIGARMGLAFIYRRGVDVGDKLDWLDEMFTFLRTEFGVEAAISRDPMELLDWPVI